MTRSLCALFVLLTALAGPLLCVGAVRAQSSTGQNEEASVCTPPQDAVHPADLPAYDVSGEDWRDFVDYGSETSHVECPAADALDEYSDLYDSLTEAAAEPAQSLEPTIVEAEPEAYHNDPFECEDYQPYAECQDEDLADEVADEAADEECLDEAYAGEEFADEELANESAPEAVADEELTDEAADDEYGYMDEEYMGEEYADEELTDGSTPEVAEEEFADEELETAPPSPQPYECEFSGYDTPDYLRDNYNYDSYTPSVAETPLRSPEVLHRWAQDQLDTLLAADAVTDAIDLSREALTMSEQLSSSFSFDGMIAASEDAWDRLEAYNRESAPPLPTVKNEAIGYRLPGDDCGWECWYSYQFVPQNPKFAPGEGVAAKPEPQFECHPSMEDVVAAQALQRDVILSVARSLRRLAGQIEDASELVAEMGGIDVAELGTGSAAR